MQHSSGPCAPDPPAPLSNAFPPLPTFANKGTSSIDGNALGVEKHPRRNSDGGYASGGSSSSHASSVYPASEVPEGATPDDFQEGARFSPRRVGTAPNAWKARSAGRAFASPAHTSSTRTKLMDQDDHPAHVCRGYSDSRKTPNLDASYSLPRQPYASIDGPPTSIPVQVKTIPATTPAAPRQMLAGFPDNNPDDPELVEQVPCFDFPTSPSEFRAFADDTPVPNMGEMSPHISLSSMSSELATPIESVGSPSPKPGRRVSSRPRRGPARLLAPHLDKLHVSESVAASLPERRKPRPKAKNQAAYYTSNNWMDCHPSNDPPPPPPPTRSSGQMTLADIAKRSKPKQTRPRPVEVNSKKSGRVLKMQPRRDALEPQFEDEWSSFGGEVSRGGQGGAVVQDDGWGGAGVYTASQDRFGGW